MRKAIITGGTGVIGIALAKELSENGYEVHVTARKVGPNAEHLGDATFHSADIRDRAAMEAICAGATHIFHLAAAGNVIQDAIDDPILTESVNVGGTMLMLELARSQAVEKFVFMSSAAVYGEQDSVPFTEELAPRPMDPYGLTKLLAEESVRFWASTYAVPAVSLRVFNAYGDHNPIGPHELVIGRFLDLRLRGEPLTVVGDGTSTRDYVHADDIARAARRTAESELKAGEIINIGSGVETSLAKLVELMGGPVNRVESVAGSFAGPSRRVAGIARAKELLGWEPTVSVEEGIARLKAEVGIS